MCITFPGRVLALERGGALVEVDGRRRRASTLLEPQTAVGDWVIVGAGTVLRRLDPGDAVELTRSLRAARAATNARTLATPATPATQGGPR